jgi:hypothetical protein
MTESDALRILHVNRGASQAQIRQAYMDLVKVWHPDRFQHDARLREKADRTLRSINEAYAALQRGTYDADPVSGSAPRSGPPPKSTPADTVPPPPATPLRPYLLMAALVGAGIGVALALAVALRPSVRPAADAGATSPAAAETDPRTATADIAPASADDRARTAASRASAPSGARRTGMDTSAFPAPRPESGADLRRGSLTGQARLSILNEIPRDAAIVLTDAAGERMIYVRGGEKLTLLDVAPGTYRVRLTTGADWTPRGFARMPAYFERDQPLVVADGASLGTTTLVLTASPALRSIAPFLSE